MAFEFKFPDVGEGIHEGEIVRWRVKVGDEIKEDAPLVEVETAKAVVELPSPKTGVILVRNGNEGQTIHVGDLLVAIGEKGEKYTPQSVLSSANASAPSSSDAGGASKSAPGVVGSIPTEEKGVVLPGRGESLRGAGTTQSPVLPRLRKLAQDLGVDLTKVKGTGPGGQITEPDVIARSTATKAPAACGGHSPGGSQSTQPPVALSLNPEKFGPVERVALKGVRRAVSEHMAASMRTIPHVTHMEEFDATNLIALRASKKAEAEKQGVKLTYLAYIVKAVALTLKNHKTLNAALDDASQEIVFKKYYNIGIAVDTPDGLMVPIIKNADQKNVFVIAKEIVELAQKARDKKLSPAEMEGGTFTVTNVGSIGGIFATPIIPIGQSAILAVMKMKDKPVAVDGSVVIRPIMSIALAYDHRVLDGADGARFANELIGVLENPNF